MTSMFEVRDAYRACFTVQPKPAPRKWWQFWSKPEPRLTPPSVIVLEDLRRVCYGTRTTASKDAIAMAVAEGRRQVWLHFQQRLTLTDAQIERLLTPHESQPLI